VSLDNPSGRAPILGDVTEFDCSVTGDSWSWAEKNAAAILAYWEKAKAEKPDLFDGEVLVATEVGIERSRLVSEHAVTRYSALTYWKSLGFPHAGAFNLFGAGVVVTSDGAVLLGRMADHTANAGYSYFPCGTPDTGDIVDGKLDIESSILREMEEETGLGPQHLHPSDQRWISWDGPLFCCARRLDTPLTAIEAGTLAANHLASHERPELAQIVFSKTLDDLEGLKVPAYAEALLRQVLV
jgi:8-oxo-dGTP pyrophosphatase MutT (NUDIX family)